MTEGTIRKGMFVKRKHQVLKDVLYIKRGIFIAVSIRKKYKFITTR